MYEPKFIKFSFPGLPRVKCIFQTRQGGYSIDAYAQGNISLNVGDDVACVLKNRQSLFNCLAEQGLTSWADLKQVHGDKIIFEPEPVSIKEPSKTEADGLISSRHGLGLVIGTADCQPLLLAEKSGQYIAALHVGWRGNRINFPKSGVKAFAKYYDLPLQDILVVRGPSLGPANCEFVNFASEWADDFLHWYDFKTKTLNLWNLTEYQLQTAGILSENIFSVDICTLANQELFYSYRRDKDKSGRQCSVIWLDYE